MDKLNIVGIGLVTIILTSLGTIYLSNLGEKTGCRTGWQYISLGEFEGYYKCITSTNVRYEMCFEVYNSSGTQNYWCKRGKILMIEKQGKIMLKQERCYPPPLNKCESI